MKLQFLLFIGCIAGLFGCTASKKVLTPAMEMGGYEAAVPKTDTFLTHLLTRYPQYFDSILRNNDVWNIQIIYTQIDRNAANKPLFTNHYFNVDPANYYYPASTVKMPVAALALQKLNELNIPGLNRNTTMITEAAFSGQTPVYNDPTTADGRPTIAQYIKKIFLVSDNDAFNRLYEFLGQEYINTTLHKMGYDSVQILHRLSIPLSEDENRTTNPIRFFDSASHSLYQQPMVKSNMTYQPRKTLMGKGYYSGDQLINQPFDFSAKNRLALPDLQAILQSLIFPEAVPQKQRFNLTDDDYRFLHRYMSMMPRESDYPQYDTSYNDSYVKFLLYGAHEAVDSNIRIFNKPGDAYGFLTDAAYIVDFKNGVEFMLSANIQCASNGIYNYDHYDYDQVGYPFMKHLGEVIYQYERQRKRKRAPDLSAFKFNYGK